MVNKILYMKLNRHVERDKADFFLSDIGKFVCQDEHVLAKIKSIKVYSFEKDGDKRQVISALKIIEMIHQKIKEIDSIENIGETEIIIEQIVIDKRKIWRIVKIALVSLVCFFGTMFTIMAFHNDIGINQLFEKIYQMFTGEKSDGYTVLEFFYSIGLSMGIIIFYNHIGKRRITKDPTPVEVEMRLYENDINTSLVETADREGKTIDVV